MAGDAALLGYVQIVVRLFEICGIGVIVAGAAASAVRCARQARSAGWDAAYRGLRSNIGRSILLGLELLVAADIINTVTIEPSLDNLAVLAAIVAIRTFLSISLEVEIEGRWPWRREAR